MGPFFYLKKMSGYHKKKITRGEFGTISKIIEEYEELIDAHEQGAKIMVLCELADLYGAMEGYIEREYNLSMKDIEKMSSLTKKAFKDMVRVKR